MLLGDVWIVEASVRLFSFIFGTVLLFSSISSITLSFTSTRFLCFLSSFALICDFTSIFMLLLFLFIIVSCYLFSFHSSVPRLQLFIIMLSHSLSYVYIFIIFFTLYLNNNTILLLPLCWLYLSSFPPFSFMVFFFTIISHLLFLLYSPGMLIGMYGHLCNINQWWIPPQGLNGDVLLE